MKRQEKKNGRELGGWKKKVYENQNEEKREERRKWSGIREELRRYRRGEGNRRREQRR